MATIGTFKKTNDEYTGEIVTLTVQAKKVRIIPADPSFSAPVFANLVERDDGESHRLLWSRQSGRGED